MWNPTATSRVEREIDLMRDEAASLLGCGPSSVLHAALFDVAGKLLRPRMLLLCTHHGEETGGSGDWSIARRAALAIELIHLGTLYHDDVVDRSSTRRGLPAVHKRFGTRAAAVGGAHLIALGNALAASLPDPLVRRWGVAAVKLAEGQLRETELAGSHDRSLEDFVRNARRKTASVFELSAFFGSSIGEALPADRIALVKFGRHFGTAFQLWDDLADFVTLDSDHRRSANDLRERTYTLPVLLGCAPADAVGLRLRDLLRDDGRPLSESAIVEVCVLLRESGAFEQAARRMVGERDQAYSSLDALTATEPLDALRAMLTWLEPPTELGLDLSTQGTA